MREGIREEEVKEIWKRKKALEGLPDKVERKENKTKASRRAVCSGWCSDMCPLLDSLALRWITVASGDCLAGMWAHFH